MDFDAALAGFGQLQIQYGGLLDTGLLIFTRTLTFIFFAPIFNRKDIPFVVKVPIALFLTAILIWVVPVESHGSFSKGDAGHFVLQIFMNIFIGALIGFAADMVMKAIYSAGSFMNNQIGLSSAMIFDPSSRKQVFILEPLFGFVGAAIFIQIGGMYWLILALQRSFEKFPVYNIQQPIMEVVPLEYLIHLSANVLLIGAQLVAPILIVTMAVDLVLGIMNRTAQQMPVFQLSFALKPCIGVAVLLATMPLMIESMVHFFQDYAQFF